MKQENENGHITVDEQTVDQAVEQQFTDNEVATIAAAVAAVDGDDDGAGARALLELGGKKGGVDPDADEEVIGDEDSALDEQELKQSLLSKPAKSGSQTQDFESELQEFFGQNGNWQRFYADSEGVEQQQQHQHHQGLRNQDPNHSGNEGGQRQRLSSPSSHPNLFMASETEPGSVEDRGDPEGNDNDDNDVVERSPKRQRVQDVDVDPALELLEKEQSQLQDAMMHASAIVRTLEKGSNGNGEKDSALHHTPSVQVSVPVSVSSPVQNIQHSVTRLRKDPRRHVVSSTPLNSVHNLSQEDTISGGNFSQQETEQIQKFMDLYCQTHNLTRHQLCERVWSSNRHKDHFWDDVTNVLPHRTRASVYKHIRRAYHVFQVRGKWTPEEDRQLGMMVEKEGKVWKAIGLAMGRMPEDCRDRWRNYVKCGNNRVQNKWSTEEEEKLRKIIENYHVHHEIRPSSGGRKSDINWTEVSELMGGTRSRIQCRYKWMKIKTRAAIAKIEAMMPGDKIALLTYIKDSGYENESDIDWDGLAVLDSRGFWTGKELKTAFLELRKNMHFADMTRQQAEATNSNGTTINHSGEKKSFKTVVNDLLEDLMTLPENKKTMKYQGPDPESMPHSHSHSHEPEPASRSGVPLIESKEEEFTDELVAVAAAAIENDKKQLHSASSIVKKPTSEV